MLMRIKLKMKPIICIGLVCLLGVSVLGCAKLKDWIGKIKGELVGQHFTITTYDDYANKTLSIEGKKVTVGLLENSANFDAESTDFKSEVLEITINGKQMFQVGNTVIFEEDGLNVVEHYDIKDEIKANSGGGYVPFDRAVNKLKNELGKKKTIIISSQQGVPIGVYQGDDVYVTIPEDLPKMTRLNIDGKALYIHRANYVIIDTEMIEG
ncbi:hypothetical protein CNEONATC25_01182 [Clostridium neonatale]|uniref:DUF5052 domain-containing protein n=3 Tax=Clostridiaceae TaxID=31979 RepID=A0A650M862_9CLOT|nr:Conserved hypothetical protein [Clostridium neonatale]CAI3540414.1 Conserved hypothetical protein [Clostridium neonatale]CAI3553850.1 Conserved hypothetical protein [Clostridium neonatale]CAI3582144.1 Conserved hypothetical protein [Clostridium neonatale]CAI3583736.1 Conserved hypothetical protein [Clostridium neonatale]